MAWRHRLIGWIAAAMLAPAAALAQPEDAADPSLNIDLNRLEQIDANCRTYFVFVNETDIRFVRLRLDLFIFGGDGIVSSRVAVSQSEVGPGRTRVGLFDIPALECATIGRFLLNDVSCETEMGARSDCIALITVSSRTTAEFLN